jgi:hypothetical protein
VVPTIAARDEQLRQVAAMAVRGLRPDRSPHLPDRRPPDVNKIGTLDDPRQSFIDAEAKPVAASGWS